MWFFGTKEEEDVTAAPTTSEEKDKRVAADPKSTKVADLPSLAGLSVSGSKSEETTNTVSVCSRFYS